MASVVIICSGIAIYQLHKKHKAKKALRLEEEKETVLANEQARVLQQLEDDRSSVYSGHTLMNEPVDSKPMGRVETNGSTASSSRRRGLREKVRGLGRKRTLEH